MWFLMLSLDHFICILYCDYFSGRYMLNQLPFFSSKQDLVYYSCIWNELILLIESSLFAGFSHLRLFSFCRRRTFIFTFLRFKWQKRKYMLVGSNHLVYFSQTYLYFWASKSHLQIRIWQCKHLSHLIYVFVYEWMPLFPAWHALFWMTDCWHCSNINGLVRFLYCKRSFIAYSNTFHMWAYMTIYISGCFSSFYS